MRESSYKILSSKCLHIQQWISNEMGCKPFYGNTPLLVDLANIYFVYGLGIASCNIAYI